MKKLLFMFVGIVCSLTAMGETVSDLVAINKNWTFIADEITSNGTAGLSANTLYCDGFIFANTGNTAAANKGASTFAGGSHLNSLRVKNTQDQLVFKLDKACTVTFYSQSHGSRGINLGTTAGGTDLGVQPASTAEWEVDLPAGVVYMSSYGGDFYFAGFVVSGFTSADKAPTISVPASYSGDTKHTINVKATVDGSPAPTIQWYSNTTASNTNGTKIEGATGATYQFNPTTAGTYYLYAVAENKVSTATSGVTTVTVTNAYKATFSKGESGAIGTAPALIYTAGDGKLNVPTNYSLFVEGKTLASWTDGVNEYLPGQQYTISEDVALTPNFVTNVKALKDVKEDTTVKFINSNSVAATYQSSNTNAIVESATIDGQKTDVAILVKNGKFDLQPSGPRAQTNLNTVVSIPVTDGAKIVINIYDNKDNGERTYTATINGESVGPYLSEETGKQRVMTYTYSGADGYVDYVVGAGNMYAYCIDVTYYPSSLTPSDLAAANTMVNVAAGATATVGYTTSSTGAVSVESNAEGVATAVVDGNNVVITGVNEGTAKITLSQASTDTYGAGQVVIDVTVKIAPFEVTENGQSFLLTKDNIAAYGFVSVATDNWSDRKYDNVTSKYYNMSNSARTLSFKVDGAKSATLVIQNSGSSVRNFTVKIGEYSNTFAVPANSSTTFDLGYVNSTAEEMTINLAGDNGSVYPICLTFYKDQIALAKVTSAGYATFYDSQNAVLLPEGVEGYIFGMDLSTFTMDLDLHKVYSAGDAVPAGEPVVLKAAAKDYVLTYTTTDALPVNEKLDAYMNFLEGSDVDAMTTVGVATEGYEPEECYFYALSLDTNGENVGFYWMNETGAPFETAAHKAYLVVPTELTGDYGTSYAKSSFPFNPDNTVTGIRDINTVAKNSAAFNLAGQRVAKNAKGIVIINGTKRINK